MYKLLYVLSSLALIFETDLCAFVATTTNLSQSQALQKGGLVWAYYHCETPCIYFLFLNIFFVTLELLSPRVLRLPSLFVESTLDVILKVESRKVLSHATIFRKNAD